MSLEYVQKYQKRDLPKKKSFTQKTSLNYLIVCMLYLITYIQKAGCQGWDNLSTSSVFRATTIHPYCYK